ncbi:MAG: hypothetical protein CSA38_00600 [Flavobacteriales bacterium]|nr:MAG: hypothetical protein CSA38_00600 [Flavobacteriales bacterium]
MKQKVLLPIFYLPPISWFSVYENQETEVVLEQWEHFPKQTYRNRTHILGANGKLILTIPKKRTGERKPLKDVEISYTEDWQSLHWKSIKIAYQTSPYFEFYEDQFFEIYQNKEKFLLDFNLRTLDIIKRIIKSETAHSLNTAYQKEPLEEDFRSIFSAKKESVFEMPDYYQSFSDKFGFTKDLSILDLICNKGPETRTYLRNIKLINNK